MTTLAQSSATRKLLDPSPIGDEDYLHVDMGQNFFVLTPKSDRENGAARWQSRSGWPAKIPGAKYVMMPQPHWLTPVTDFTVLVCASTWKDRIVFENKDVELEWNYLLLRFVKANQAAEAQADFWVNGKVPENAPKGNEFNPLSPYQRVAAYCAIGAEGYALFKEQGTGKTATTIARMDAEHDIVGNFYSLVVCPKNVRSNWLEELKKFSTKRVFANLIKGGRIERTRCFLDALLASRSDDFDYAVSAVSYESLANSIEQLENLPCSIYLTVLDESQYIKSPKAKRWGVMQRLRSLSEKRMCLTGTPVANTLFDLFTQLEFLGEGWSGFASYDQFKHFHGVFDAYHDGRSSVQRLASYQNVPLLQERLTRCAFICRKDQVLTDLPKKQYQLWEVEMSAQQIKAYDKLAKELYLEIEGDMAASNNDSMTAQNALTKLLRLSQITSGFMVTDKTWDYVADKEIAGRIVPFDKNPKLDALKELLKQELHDNSKCVIWAHYTYDIQAIYDALTEEGHKCVTYYGKTSERDREAAKLAFNEGDARIWISNAGAGGTGLNLLGKSGNDMAADLVVYYSQDWSAIKRSQSEDRTHRRGTARAVRYFDLCVLDTIDFKIRAAVLEKRKMAASLQDVRSILKDIIHG